MNNQYVPTPVQAYYYPPQSLGGCGLGQPAQPIAPSSWLILGAIGLGLFLWTTSQRTKSKDF